MLTAFCEANQAVRALGICRVTKTTQHKMSCYCLPPGTTASALWIEGDRAVIGHCGDSRIWHIRGPTAARRTEDHTFWGGNLYKAIGLTDTPPDLCTVEVQPGDRFVLITDGVLLAGENLYDVAMVGPPEGLAQRIVEAGMRRYGATHLGSQDNATCVVVLVAD